jgi:hypothetical protein
LLLRYLAVHNLPAHWVAVLELERVRGLVLAQQRVQPQQGLGQGQLH